MFGSFAYKEWIKLRLYWVLLLVAYLAFCVFLCLQLRRVCAINDTLSVWTNWLFKNYLFFQSAKYGPLIMGIVFGALQFFPEVLGKRLRLVLHLPLGEEKAGASHIAIGLGLLTLAFLPGVALLAGYASIWFPREFLVQFAFLYAPWLLAGYAAYLFTAITVLEPTWRFRVVYLLMGAAFTKLLFIPAMYDSYSRLFPWMVLITAASAIVPLLSLNRFGKGYGS